MWADSQQSIDRIQQLTLIECVFDNVGIGTRRQAVLALVNDLFIRANISAGSRTRATVRYSRVKQ